MSRLTRWPTFVTVSFLAALASAGPQEADSISPAPAAWTPAKRAAIEWVESNQPWVGGLSRSLWLLAEPGMLEYKSADRLTGYLEEYGFIVERGVAAMPTAFEHAPSSFRTPSGAAQANPAQRARLRGTTGGDLVRRA